MRREKISIRLGQPEDQTLQPQAAKIVGHLAWCIFGGSDAKQVDDQSSQIAVMKSVD
jgi:hypothetical protein